MPGLKELLAQREALQQELEQARQQEADRALREIVAKMREYKISLQELIGTRAHARSRTQSTVTRPPGRRGAGVDGRPSGSQTRTATIS